MSSKSQQALTSIKVLNQWRQLVEARHGSTLENSTPNGLLVAIYDSLLISAAPVEKYQNWHNYGAFSMDRLSEVPVLSLLTIHGSPVVLPVPANWCFL